MVSSIWMPITDGSCSSRATDPLSHKLTDTTREARPRWSSFASRNPCTLVGEGDSNPRDHLRGSTVFEGSDLGGSSYRCIVTGDEPYDRVVDVQILVSELVAEIDDSAGLSDPGSSD